MSTHVTLYPTHLGRSPAAAAVGSVLLLLASACRFAGGGSSSTSPLLAACWAPRSFAEGSAPAAPPLASKSCSERFMRSGGPGAPGPPGPPLVPLEYMSTPRMPRAASQAASAARAASASGPRVPRSTRAATDAPRPGGRSRAAPAGSTASTCSTPRADASWRSRSASSSHAPSALSKRLEQSAPRTAAGAPPLGRHVAASAPSAASRAAQLLRNGRTFRKRPPLRCGGQQGDQPGRAGQSGQGAGASIHTVCSSSVMGRPSAGAASQCGAEQCAVRRWVRRPHLAIVPVLASSKRSSRCC